ncbi:MAG: NYN domain-containing protein [Armatimonadetes bacterium]|nr:NYN domain-containing protein [Armatimonadota bacterium]
MHGEGLHCALTHRLTTRSRSDGDRAFTPKRSSLVARHQRVGVLVDVQNMFYSAKHQYRAKLDFQKLLDAAVQDRQLVRAIAYIVQTPEIDQTSFINTLRQIGYEVKTKMLRTRPDGTTKGDWDMGMAIDAISMADRLDAIVLVSGDGDFVELVSMLKAQGVRVEVLSFPSSTAEELKLAATEFSPIGPDMLLGGSQPALNGNGRSCGQRLFSGEASGPGAPVPSLAGSR